MSVTTSSLAALRSALHQAWSQRSPREQLGIQWALGLLAVSYTHLTLPTKRIV